MFVKDTGVITESFLVYTSEQLSVLIDERQAFAPLPLPKPQQL